MWKMKTAGALAFALVAALSAGACSEDATRTIVEVQKKDTVTVTVTLRDTVRIGTANLVFDQIERLGNPLVSEVFVEKREHDFFNTTNPVTDPANFRDDIQRFITSVAGRDAAYAATVAAALTPDMLAVFPNRAPGVTAATADASALVGWLTHALSPGTGYGGRKLDNDDAVDKGLSVIFGTALGNNNNVSPGLSTDNVPDNQTDPDVFPYVAAPN